MENSRAPGRAGLSCHQQWDDWGRFAPGTPGIALVFAVLLRFGFLALVRDYAFLSMEYFPLTTDMSRPYAGASVMLLLGIAALATYGFYASRGGEPLFGRPLLD